MSLFIKSKWTKINKLTRNIVLIIVLINNINRVAKWIEVIKKNCDIVLKITCKKTLKYGEKRLLKIVIKILNVFKNKIGSIVMSSKIIETNCH